MSNNQSIDPFVLGEINATVKGTAEDVKAIRMDVGAINDKLHSVEKRVEVNENRIADSAKRIHTLSNSVQVLEAKQHKQTGFLVALTGIAAFIGSLVAPVANYLLKAPAAPAQGYSAPAATQTAPGTPARS